MYLGLLIGGSPEWGYSQVGGNVTTYPLVGLIEYSLNVVRPPTGTEFK